jgi:hypothetical protein
MIVTREDPLEALLRVRTAISTAVDATESYQYEEFNVRMRALETEARELFRYFDHAYSDPDPVLPEVKL